LRVIINENILDRRGFGGVIGEQSFELRSEVRQAKGQSLRGVGLELPVGDVLETIAVGFDQAPSRRGERGIETQDPQASFSNSSSGTS
jgi:hypothetical protein